MKPGITCLIPFYNENQRLIDTVRNLSPVKSIDTIVCIDDGSTDNSTLLLRKHFPKITVIRLRKNQGKTEAVRQGLQSIKTSHTLLLDADLLHLVAGEIQDVINLAISSPEIDMIILQRVHEPFFVRLFRFDTILSGQRIIKTHHLKKILQSNISHYDLEVAMNEYAYKHKLRVLRFPISAINSRRIDKWGAKRSVFTNISMLTRFIEHPGIFTMVKQILYFAKD